ncbi:vesicle-associated membrane protein 1-like isoform X1 [Leguminivora glycinivorella]|uniref:vesicle-associated membrane protein 1-like isoform X1 n=1 Tax=Leguminivora glycinivorella TaxID=1035111 RepID=UPI00201070C0|nr:vesicle-associated membrane protein 1-like isoform X1 [Leguminivora glycinivorella]
MGKDKEKDAEAAAPPPGPPGPPKPREPQYGPDGELLGGPHTMQQQAAQRRLQQTQAQVDEVVDIMKTNMDKVLERDHLISDLSERAEALEDGASAFKSQAASLKNKFWLENLKSGTVAAIPRRWCRRPRRPRQWPRLRRLRAPRLQHPRLANNPHGEPCSRTCSQNVLLIKVNRILRLII